jgi:hypothetical protein
MAYMLTQLMAWSVTVFALATFLCMQLVAICATDGVPMDHLHHFVLGATALWPSGGFTKM